MAVMVTEEQDARRESVIRLAFGGDEERFREFVQIVKDAVPDAHAAVLRGSSVTGFRWKDDAPFDADGPGTSDLDLTLIGAEVLSYYKLTGFFVPGMHTRPVSKDDPDIAPALIPLREQLMAMVGRPVNIQASRDAIQQFRGEVLGQPYLVLFGSIGDPAAS